MCSNEVLRSVILNKNENYIGDVKDFYNGSKSLCDTLK